MGLLLSAWVLPHGVIIGHAHPLGSTTYICTQKNVGFGLGWDTQIPRNPNPNKTQMCKPNPKITKTLTQISQNSENFPQTWLKNSKKSKSLKSPKKSQPKNVKFWVVFWEKFSGFWDFWAKVLVIFGSCLGWDFMGFGCPNPKPTFIWVQMYVRQLPHGAISEYSNIAPCGHTQGTTVLYKTLLRFFFSKPPLELL